MANMCNCDLRHRSWNPQTGRCENCNCLFRDLRNGVRGGQGEGTAQDGVHTDEDFSGLGRSSVIGTIRPVDSLVGTSGQDQPQQAAADAEGVEEEAKSLNPCWNCGGGYVSEIRDDAGKNWCRHCGADNTPGLPTMTFRPGYTDPFGAMTKDGGDPPVGTYSHGGHFTRRLPAIEYEVTIPRSGRGDAITIIGTVLSLLSAIYIVASLCSLWPEQWAGVLFSDYKWRYLLAAVGAVGGLCMVGYGLYIRNRPALSSEGTTMLWGVLTALACTVIACVSITFDNWWIASGFIAGALIGVLMVIFGDRGADDHVPDDDGVFVDAVEQDPSIPTQVVEKCTACGGELEFAYGLAGGGCGAYQYCGDCGKVVSKQQDTGE